MSLKKKNKMKPSDFYPKIEMFHYINQDFFGDENNSTLIAEQFYKNIGYYPDLINPQTLNEKILWLTQHHYNPLMTLCADKYLVKNYIKEQLGEDLCVPTLKTYDSIYDINLDELPDKFVLKVNWGHAGKQVMVVKDKNEVSIDQVRMRIDDWVQPWNNFYFTSFSSEYKDMKPTIYAEEYLEDRTGQLNKCEVCCFNGKAQMTLVITDKKGKVTKTFFDNAWKLLPVKRSGAAINKKLQKPKEWKKMVTIAEKLARSFPLLCVDFYSINGKLYVGKLKFHMDSNFAAFTPREWDKKFGDMLSLPK